MISAFESDPIILGRFELSKRLLWIRKRPLSSGNPGGDEIYDQKIIEKLEEDFEIVQYYMDVQSRWGMVKALSRGVPHPRYKYHSDEIVSKLRAIAPLFDGVIVSWETFDFIPSSIGVPVTLIVHNVMSDALVQIFPNSLVGKIASYQSLRWERNHYSKNDLNVIVLSNRDEQIILDIYSGADVSVASPGCPASVEIEAMVFIPEVVVSGSYDWMPKRRDVKRIAIDYEDAAYEIDFRLDNSLPEEIMGSRLEKSSRSIKSSEYSAGIRIGFIPDTFLGGFKLKSTFYVAMNCMVLSRCDIREEFYGLPHADEFVRVVDNLSDVAEIASSIASSADEAFFRRWHEFKQACLARFNWAASAQVIASRFSRL